MVEEIKKNFSAFSKVFAGVILVLGIVILIIAKNSKPDFSTGLFILILFLILIVSGLFFFTPKKVLSVMKGKVPEENEEFNIPKSIGLGDAKELFNKYFLYNQEYGKPVRKIMKQGVEIHGKIKPQRIYYKWFEDTERTEWFFAVNMHFPEMGVTIISNPSSYDISEGKKRLIVFKEEEKDSTRAITMRPDGTQTVYEEKREPQVKIKSEKPKEDLLRGDE